MSFITLDQLGCLIDRKYLQLVQGSFHDTYSKYPALKTAQQVADQCELISSSRHSVEMPHIKSK